MYLTVKLDDNGCRIHSVSDDGNGWIVTNKRYVMWLCPGRWLPEMVDIEPKRIQG